MFESLHFHDHERVVQVSDAETGLRAIVAIHSTALGPAAGGCRLWQYDRPGNALDDALRLSRGMSYKNAIAGLPMGGGKAVILGPVDGEKRDTVFRAFGRAVDALGGSYITAEDVGVSESDLRTVAAVTRYISGITMQQGVGGNPSPFTAKGVRIGIEASVEHGLGRSDLTGVSIAVQGLGGVGFNLCRELNARGAKLVVADIARQRVEEACDLFGATPADPTEILTADVDVLAPCALGAVITADMAGKLRAKIVAGGANNQLATPDVGKILQQRGITYAPDYVINAGGIIVVTAEYLGTFDPVGIHRSIEKIGERTRKILAASKRTGVPSNEVADAMAEDIIRKAATKRAA